MDNRLRCTRRLRMPIAVAFAGLTLAGLCVGTSTPAEATVLPGLSLSSSGGPVGSVVSVTYSSPPGNGCGGVVFSSTAGVGGGSNLPYGGNVGSQHFVIPSFLGGLFTPPGAPVSPGPYMFSITCDTTNDPATAVTLSVPFAVTAPLPSRFVGLAITADGKGYWLAQAGGGVFSYGDATFFGSLPGVGITPAAPIVGIAATSDGKGYWLVGADGGVFCFGDARFYGSLPEQHIVPTANYLYLDANAIVGITADPTGGGYWLVGEDGGVFGFGTARYLGSAPQPGNLAVGLSDEPFVGLGATADGGGYYEAGFLGGAMGFGGVASSSGGLVNIGNVRSLASLISGVAVTPRGDGVWFVGRDGGVFAIRSPGGSAPPAFFGSLPGEGIVPAAPVIGIAATSDGKGYWLVGADGGIFTFGDAGFCGSAGGSGLPW
jgi:hypothetical protein